MCRFQIKRLFRIHSHFCYFYIQLLKSKTAEARLLSVVIISFSWYYFWSRSLEPTVLMDPLLTRNKCAGSLSNQNVTIFTVLICLCTLIICLCFLAGSTTGSVVRSNGPLQHGSSISHFFEGLHDLVAREPPWTAQRNFRYLPCLSCLLSQVH